MGSIGKLQFSYQVEHSCDLDVFSITTWCRLPGTIAQRMP